MTTTSLMEYSNNNIFVFRFKILYHFYEKLFWRIHDDDILGFLKTKYDITSAFLFNNVEYLRNSGYLQYAEPKLAIDLGISYKGIQFVECITDGNMDFDDENISQESLNQIRRKFKEQDVLVEP